MKTRWKQRLTSGYLSLGFVLLALGLFGCKWDASKHDAFVNDDGEVESCEGVLSEIVMRDGTVCKRDDCPGEKCAPNCSDIPLLSVAFERNLCPKNLFCDETETGWRCSPPSLECVENVCNQAGECGNRDTRCGKECINCNTANQAVSGECREGVCTITECAVGHHKEKEDENGIIICTKNTHESCGKTDSTVTKNCTKDDGADRGICNLDGTCLATRCISGYTLSTGKCWPYTVNNCGDSGDCRELPGWGTGECNTIDGICEATSCKTGSEEESELAYCLQEGKTCVDGRHNALFCGKEGGKQLCQDCADEGMRCVDGECKSVVCDNLTLCYKDSECRNDKDRCGLQCLNCTTANNAKDGYCNESGECVIIACRDGHHFAENDRANCVRDTLEACGLPNNDCSKLEGWLSGRCENGKCTVEMCEPDYRFDEGVCIKNSTTSCGENETNCEQGGWLEGSCFNGQCQASKCKANYCLQENAVCVDGLSNVGACGKDGGECRVCVGRDACIDGVCVEVDCFDNNVCSRFSQRGWSGGRCTNGKCEPAGCSSSYTLIDGTCRASCGSELCNAGAYCNNSNKADCRCAGNDGGCMPSQKCCVTRTGNKLEYRCLLDSNDTHICPP